MQEKEILTVEEAAEFLGFSAYTVRKLARQGIIPGTKMGRQWRFSRPGLVRYVEERSLAHSKEARNGATATNGGKTCGTSGENEGNAREGQAWMTRPASWRPLST